MAKKLSKTQEKVLRLMADGWELGRSHGLVSRVWLQKNGIGKGGPSLNITHPTFLFLFRHGLLESKRIQFPTNIYELSEAGRALVDP